MGGFKAHLSRALGPSKTIILSTQRSKTGVIYFEGEHYKLVKFSWLKMYDWFEILVAVELFITHLYKCIQYCLEIFYGLSKNS